MATKDGFDADDSLLHFLSTDEPEQNFGNDRPVTLLRVILKASILVAMAIAIGVAPVENPVKISAKASLFDKAASPPSTDQSAPIIQSALIQSTAGAEALPPTVKNAPIRTRTENTGSSPEALFREFQAWSAEQDAQALAKPVQDAPARVVENAPASVRPMQKHRRARSVHSARAETRHVREHRANVQHRQAHARPVQDARAQTEPIQNTEPPSFLESLNPFAGWPTLTIR